MMTLLPRPWRHVIPPCTCSFRSALVAAGQSWVFSRQFRVSEASPESSPLGLFSSFLLACWGQGPQGWGITCLGSCPRNTWEEEHLFLLLHHEERELPLHPSPSASWDYSLFGQQAVGLEVSVQWPLAPGGKRLTGHTPVFPLRTTKGQLRGHNEGEAASSAPLAPSCSPSPFL